MAWEVDVDFRLMPGQRAHECKLLSARRLGAGCSYQTSRLVDSLSGSLLPSLFSFGASKHSPTIVVIPILTSITPYQQSHTIDLGKVAR